MKQELNSEQIKILVNQVNNIIDDLKENNRDEFKNEAINWSDLSVAIIEYRKDVYPEHKDNSSYYVVVIEELSPENYEFMSEVDFRFKEKYSNNYSEYVNIYFECAW